MIHNPPNYKGKLTDKEVQKYADRYGYDLYIPYNFVRDLLSCWANGILYGDLTTGIDGNTDYERSLINFVRTITIDSNTRPYEFVFNVLKTQGNKVNLRRVESSMKFGTMFDVDKEDIYPNYKVDLGAIPKEILDVFDVRLEDIDRVVLNDEVLSILTFYQSFTNLPGDFEDKPELVRDRIRSYNQLVKVSKHVMIYPSFKYDLAMKQVRVKQPVIKKIKHTKVVIALDVSSSTENVSNYFEFFKSVLLHYYNQIAGTEKFEIKLIFYTDTVVGVKDILTKKDIIDVINLDIKPLPSFRGWQEAYDYIEKEFDGEYIINITEMDDETLVINKVPNNIWHIITFNKSNKLNKLAKISAGTYTNANKC